MEIEWMMVVWVKVDTKVLKELMLEEGAGKGDRVKREGCETWF
jgi:hypothetical protein